MGTITTAMTTSSKAEYMSAGHCIFAPITATASSSSSTSYTSASSLAGIAVGMSFTGTDVGSGSIVAAITSASAFTSSVASTGTISGGTLTFSGDILNVALISATPTGSYGAGTTNYQDVVANSDEVSGTGYTAGGNALVNVSPVTSGTTAYVNFSPNPSWTGATFTTGGCIIYNTAIRNGGPSGSHAPTGAGRALAVLSFGGTQTVTTGVLTLLMPTAAASTAILRIS